MANITTPNAAPGWRWDQIHFFDADERLSESLYVAATTKGGDIQGDAPAVRVPYIDDADSAGFVAEGAEIPEDDPDLDEALVYTRKIGRIVKLSREQWSQPNAAANIAGSVKNDLIRKMDRALLAQVAPTAPAVAPSAGIVNLTGILEGDPITTNLDPLVDLYAELASNDATPRFLIVDPLAYAFLYKLKTDDSSSNQGLLSPATEAPTSPILGLTTQVSNAMPANSGVLIDPAAIVSAYSQLEIATSDQAYFTSDNIAIRATVRVGHTVVRPQRIGKLTIGDETP
ncbi:phage major capsid protein [Gordonia terrae]|uniref:phage major capsid protein n=1 Tax=Gordonia terrae TaxID=2055 RepID=UPI00200A87BB|nr:phage major capsid protein [Gordonia terrae]UPW09792.1 phage major capsid protein [Gordonia terrae]